MSSFVYSDRLIFILRDLNAVISSTRGLNLISLGSFAWAALIKPREDSFSSGAHRRSFALWPIHVLGSRQKSFQVTGGYPVGTFGYMHCALCSGNGPQCQLEKTTGTFLQRRLWLLLHGP